MTAPGDSHLRLFDTLVEAARADLAEVLRRLQTSPEGLSWSEAVRRLEQFGPNELSAQKPPGWPVILWGALKHPFNAVLGVLVVISFVTGDLKATVVMLAMIVLSVGLRFWQELKSQMQAESLRRMMRTEATVLRAENAGVNRKPNALNRLASDIPTRELVPGDIVLLSAGDMIPADLRLLESRDLFVTQSALTGEAMPVEKYEPERQLPRREAAAREVLPAEVLDSPHLLFMGSSIVSGTGKAVVLATGNRTYFGQMAEKLSAKRPETAFDRGVRQVSWLLIRFMLVMTPLVFLINGLLKHDWLDAFLFAVAIAVGLTPEMLPMIVNANLARGAIALARQKTIVKRLHAIQNFGAMDVLCTDKTGTLTQDKVVLIRHVDLRGSDSRRVLEHAYLNSLFQTGLKNLLDRAVIDRAEALGLREVAKQWWKVDEIPFDFVRRRMSVVLTRSRRERVLYCKGAVEEMLDICTHVEDDGRIAALSPVLREQLKALRDRLNEDGLRVVAVGYKKLPPDAPPVSAADECDLVFSGFVAFLDPAKETTAEALRLLREHGVTVKILTGDNAIVARKICRDVGLDVAHIATGAEVESLDDVALGELAERTTIFAKLSPMQKARVVRVLKARGHTVGFMGDGINDATALREADVGISVDTAVDVAREAADIILLEKSLLVLERGIVEGRRTFGNVIKYIKMTASSNFGNVFSVLVASAFLPFLPMLAVQLLVQNLLYDISQIAIPWDRMDEDWLKTPRQWNAGTIATFMLCIGPISSIFDLTTFWVMWHVFGANTVAQQSLFQSGWFVVGLLTQTLIVHMIRTEKIPFLQSTAAPVVLATTAAVMAVGVWLPFSPIASAIRLQPLPAGYFLYLPLVLVAYCLLTQAVKAVYIRRFKSWL
ncbi:magnesium-translocating P-type ATPase [Limisphaera sp. 4302-co]|uniref:magnesium-translocating P-type ATPase n=1 Tax=Limisphaera sp. 4302-co TaxID=3400417 RepID=UPI003C1BB971